MQLFKEHLGLVNTSMSKTFNYEQRQNIAVMDPLDDGFYYNVWKRTAEKNTSIYRELFKCVPDDTGKSPLAHSYDFKTQRHAHFQKFIRWSSIGILCRTRLMYYRDM